MCALEFPDLEESIWQPFRDKDVNVIGIGTGGLFGQDTDEQVSRFIEQTQVTLSRSPGNNTFKRGIDLSGTEYPPLWLCLSSAVAAQM